MKLATLLMAALLAAGALSAQAQEAPVAAAAAAPATPKARIIAMIDSALNGYNGTAIGTATCLVTVRGAGPSSDAVGTAVAGVLNADTPVIAWEQDGALLSAVIFNNVTDAKPLAGARAACHAVQKRLPSKLRKGAAVETTTFGYVFDPRKPAKKGACSWLCNKYCKKNDRKCKLLCGVAGWGCKGVCTLLRLPWIICRWL